VLVSTIMPQTTSNSLAMLNLLIPTFDGLEATATELARDALAAPPRALASRSSQCECCCAPTICATCQNAMELLLWHL
jgi:hypothetical protein